jgi:serine/threonine protein kinase
MIDDFLHQEPKACDIPLRFVSEVAGLPEINFEGRIKSISALFVGPGTAVYNIEQDDKPLIVKMSLATGEAQSDLENQKQRFNCELNALKALRSVAGVVQLEGYSERTFSLLLPYRGRSLSASTDGANWTMVGFQGVVETLKRLHEECHYIHRDIRPANIVCSQSDDFTLIDFGLAMHLGSEELIVKGPFVGTVMYAPQAHLLRFYSPDLEYSPSTDLQSFVKTLTACLLSQQAKSRLAHLGAHVEVDSETYRKMHDMWNTIFENISVAGKLYASAVRTDYDGIQQTLKHMSAYLFMDPALVSGPEEDPSRSRT